MPVAVNAGYGRAILHVGHALQYWKAERGNVAKVGHALHAGTEEGWEL